MKTAFTAVTLVTALAGAACSDHSIVIGPTLSASVGGTGGDSLGSGGEGGESDGAGGALASGGAPKGGSPNVIIVDEPMVDAGVEVDAGPEPTCGVQDFNRERKPSEVILVLDRSGSMENRLATGESKWEATVPTVINAIEATNSEIWWGYKSYPELDETKGCAPESIVPTIHSPIAENNTAAVIAQIQATTPLGDGTPTGHAIKFALDYLLERQLMSDAPKFILLATDGEPNCSGPSGSNPLDYTVEQIGAALAAGFPTFVIGVDTTREKSRANLNAMAVAGGKPRPNTNLDPTTPHDSFYLASTQAEVQAAFASITGSIASCVFELDPPPPVPENIAVDFNGVRADRDPARLNGWEYTKDDFSELEVFGSWCERIKTEAQNLVNIKYGCPNIPIPIPVPPR